MKPHRFDPLSFSFGLAFAVISVLLTLPRIDFNKFGFSWVAAGFLLLIGILIIVTSRSGPRD